MSIDDTRKPDDNYLKRFLNSSAQGKLNFDKEQDSLSKSLKHKNNSVSDAMREMIAIPREEDVPQQDEEPKSIIDRLIELNTNLIESLYPEKTNEDKKASLGIMLENIVHEQHMSSDKAVGVLKIKLDAALGYVNDERIDVENIKDFNFSEFVNELVSSIVGVDSKYFIPLQIFAVAQIYRFIGGNDIKNYMKDEFLKLGNDNPEVIAFKHKHNITLSPIEKELARINGHLGIVTPEILDVSDELPNDVKRGQNIIDKLEQFKQRKREAEAGRRSSHDIAKKFMDTTADEDKYNEFGELLAGFVEPHNRTDTEKFQENAKNDGQINQQTSQKFVDCLKAGFGKSKLEKKKEKQQKNDTVKAKYNELGELLSDVFNKKKVKETASFQEKIKKGQNVLDKLEQNKIKEEQKIANQLSKKFVDCLKVGFGKHTSKTEKEKQQREDVVKTKYNELGDLITGVFNKKKIKESEELGKLLINNIQKNINPEFISEDVINEKELSSTQWLQRIDVKLLGVVKDFLIPTSVHIDLLFRVTKYLTYKYIDRTLRDYLERELFRLRAYDTDVPFYLDGYVSETQDPILENSCSNVDVRGYGGLQPYGCSGYGDSGVGPGGIIGTEL